MLSHKAMLSNGGGGFGACLGGGVGFCGCGFCCGGSAWVGCRGCGFFGCGGALIGF